MVEARHTNENISSSKFEDEIIEKGEQLMAQGGNDDEAATSIPSKPENI